MESKMENSTHSFREKNLVLQLIQKSQIKSKTVMSWSSRKKKKAFLYRLFCPKEIFLTFVFHLNVQCTKQTFRIYILLHIKKHYFIHFLLVFKITENLKFILSLYLQYKPLYGDLCAHFLFTYIVFRIFLVSSRHQIFMTW